MSQVQSHDDDLSQFEAAGAWPLPDTPDQGFLECAGAQVWHAAYGEGPPVILLHGGLGHSGNWGHQVPALIEQGYCVIVVDSRGHGRSTRDARPYHYEQLTSDVLAVMDARHIERAGLVGWSDGAVVALMLAERVPHRTAGVFFFACNVDPSGTKDFTTLPPVVDRCFRRHQLDYARLSATPDQFEALAEAVGQMQRTEPNYSAADLARIAVPVAVVQGEHDEFIKREHAEYLARALAKAHFKLLPEVSHFAPLQRPALFNQVLLEFLGQVLG